VGRRGHALVQVGCCGWLCLAWLGAAADAGALPWDRAFRPAAPYL